MTSFKKGEIYLSEIVFTDGTATKKRPVVVVSGKHFNEKREEVVVAPITSNVIRKIAHVRKSDGAIQIVEAHLFEVSEITKKLAEKFGLPNSGALIGLFHDYGKLSSAFQNYIKACVAKELPAYKINFDIDDDSVDCKALKGKIDHSTAGAQLSKTIQGTI